MKQLLFFILPVLFFYEAKTQNALLKEAGSNTSAKQICRQLLKELKEGKKRELIEVKTGTITQASIGGSVAPVTGVNSNTMDVTGLIVLLSSQKGSNKKLYYTYIGQNSQNAIKDSVSVIFGGKCRCGPCFVDTSNVCCGNKVGTINYVLDMCEEEYCRKVKRPGLWSNGCYIRNKKLMVRQKDLLCFSIINNNPFRYELEVNQNQISFNSDHSDFDALLKKVAAAQESSLVTTGDDGDLNPEDTAQKIKEKSEAINKTFSDLKVLLGELRAYILTRSQENCVNEKDIKADQESFAKRYLDIFKGESAEDFYASGIAALKELKADKNSKNGFEKLSAQAEKHLEVEVPKIKELVEKLIKSNYSYALLPIQVSDDNADVIQVEVKRKNLVSNNSETYKYNFYVRGGIKIDFSAGPFLSALADHKYTVESKDVTLRGAGGADSVITRRVIGRQASDDFTYMVSSLMHVYRRTGGYVNGSLFLGAGLTNQARGNLLAGGSLILGREQRFCLNVGMAFGTVKRLSKPYALGSDYNSTEAVPTVEVYTMGWAFGITYNLSKPKVVADKEK